MNHRRTLSYVLYDGDNDTVGIVLTQITIKDLCIRSIKLCYAILVLVVAQESITRDATVTAATMTLKTCCPPLPSVLISTTQLSDSGYCFACK